MRNLINKTHLTGSLVLCLLVAFAGDGKAFTSIGLDWQTQYDTACSTLQDAATSAQSCVLCHTSGFGLNSYGSDLNDASLNFAAIEADDSDGDGRTNIQEILEDCKLPGDDLSVPVDGDSWESVKALYR